MLKIIDGFGREGVSRLYVYRPFRKTRSQRFTPNQ